MITPAQLIESAAMEVLRQYPATSSWKDCGREELARKIARKVEEILCAEGRGLKVRKVCELQWEQGGNCCNR